MKMVRPIRDGPFSLSTVFSVVDFRSRHSLTRAARPRLAAAGVSLGRAFLSRSLAHPLRST
ncbi:hypothetical protein [Peribacillus simplex]|uniref:hypothetical protein n=1 Tax=Peribacillus simplex TaxID=1478 RepID=UPI00366E7531